MSETASEAARSAISVVVPAYESPGTLAAICRDLTNELPRGDDLEIIIVDDGSGDDTWPEIQRLARSIPEVVGIALQRNFGQHNALFAGMRLATKPIIVTMDDDGQHVVSDVRRLVDKLDDGYDLVYGHAERETRGMFRDISSRVTKSSMRIALGPEVYPRASAFRAFRRELLSAGDGVLDPYSSVDVVLGWATTRVVDVPVTQRPRTGGVSGYNLQKLIRHALNMVTGYSVRPLRWVSVTGLLCAGVGFLLLVFILIRFVLYGSDVQGFTFLAAGVTLFSGVQLLSLGVIGEYIGRMHFRLMGRPQYLVHIVEGRERTPSNPTEHDDETGVAPI